MEKDRKYDQTTISIYTCILHELYSLACNMYAYEEPITENEANK